MLDLLQVCARMILYLAKLTFSLAASVNMYTKPQPASFAYVMSSGMTHELPSFKQDGAVRGPQCDIEQERLSVPAFKTAPKNQSATRSQVGCYNTISQSLQGVLYHGNNHQLPRHGREPTNVGTKPNNQEQRFAWPPCLDPMRASPQDHNKLVQDHVCGGARCEQLGHFANIPQQSTSCGGASSRGALWLAAKAGITGVGLAWLVLERLEAGLT
eukprot:6189394-Amphidinium_carterae.1